MLQIGKANWVNGEYYTGALDNLKIYGSAHTADQIKEAYDSTKSDAAKADANALTINNGSTDVYSIFYSGRRSDGQRRYCKASGKCM